MGKRGKVLISLLSLLFVISAGAVFASCNGGGKSDISTASGSSDVESTVDASSDGAGSTGDDSDSTDTAANGISSGAEDDIEDEEDEEDEENPALTFILLDDGTYSVRAADKSITSVKIPATYKGKPVTEIGDRGFYNCTQLTEVSIGKRIRKIDQYAFFGCTDLVNVDFSVGVTSIGNRAFYGCGNLQSISLPASVTSIDSYAFYCCSGLESITVEEGGDVYRSAGNCLIKTTTKTLVLGCKNSVIPDDGVDSIGFNAFFECNGLKSITIPDSVTSIGEYAFRGCGGLTDIALGNGLKSIGGDAFRDCNRLTDVHISDIAAWCGVSFEFIAGQYYSNPLYYAHNLYLNDELITELAIPDGVTSIGAQVFYGCDKIKRAVLSDDVTSIGDQAFYRCEGLEYIRLSDNIISIGNNAFYSCKALENITIGSGVTSIGQAAFSGCESLKTIAIPKGVKSIGSGAFLFCSGLESITVEEGNTAYHSEGDCLIETAAKTLLTGCKNSVIPNDGSVTSIESGAFRGCVGLTTVVIPVGVLSIGDSAFRECGGLESITVEEGNTVYHSEGNCLIETATKTLLRGCKNSMIPDDGSVTSIGAYAFSGCVGLTTVVIPGAVTAVQDYAFYECSGLVNVTIGGGVARIGAWAFLSCDKLTSATFENTNGWRVSASSAAGGTELADTSLANARTAAQWLRSTYRSYAWTRSE